MKAYMMRIKVNPQALVKFTSLLSNSLLLSANAFLLGSDIQRRIQEKKTETTANRIQITAEAAAAISGLAKVIVQSIETNK